MNSQSVLLKSHLATARQSLFHSEAAVEIPLKTLHAFTREVDEALSRTYRDRMDSDGGERDYCLVALGGYGRRELWPFSDIDILILRRDGNGADKMSALVKDFWNLGLSLSTVVRTPEECRAILGEDIATDTALLESRYLAGNHRLFELVQKECIRPYFEKNRKIYIDGISADLREGLFSSENSLYRVEPDLKNGICTLRDCQRLLWAERVRHGSIGFGELHTKSGFSVGEAKRLEAGYAFLAGLRSALHIAAGQRLDILETQYHQVIADRHPLGHKQAGRLLEEFFQNVREIRLSLLSFLEKDLSGKSIWRNVRSRMSSVEIVPGIALLDGIMFPLGRKDTHLDRPESILHIFRQALVCQGTLSVELRNRIRHRLDAMTSEDFVSKTVSENFLSILSWPGDIGQEVLLMHETGLLSKLIPAFSGLTCKVEYDQYHEFTVDQHTLLALCACDDLGRDPDEKIQDLYKGIEDKMILRLAVLLHDIGKAMPGDHVQNGAVIAEAVSERLGLADDQIRQLRFLVQHHLDMSNLSLLRDFDDHHLTPFAAQVGDVKMLHLLYLLTIVDIRSVGHNTWTGWKAYQLERLYDRTAAILFRMKSTTNRLARVTAPSSLSVYDEMMPEEKIGYDHCLAGLEEHGIGLFQECFAGFERLLVCADDRVGFLCDFIGCLTSEGYNILSARIHSTADGKVLDIFHLEKPDKPRLSPEKRLDNIRAKWRLIEAGRVDADSLVEDRIKKYPPPLLRRSSSESFANVRVNNGDSALATIIEIDTSDNFGLVHQIARCFYENGVNIVAAKLSTRNDQACDVFYVADEQKSKLTNQKDIERLIERLKTVCLEKSKKLADRIF